MSLAPGSIIDASGDADANLESPNLNLSKTDTTIQQTAGGELANTHHEAANVFAGPKDDTAGKIESVAGKVPGDHTAHGNQNSFPPPEVNREPHRAWENYNVHDREHADLLSSRLSAASIRSANSSDEAAFSDFGPREEPVVTTYSDGLDSPKLTGGRSKENLRNFQAEEIYDSYTPRPQTRRHKLAYQGGENKSYHGAPDQQIVEDLSPEQFRRQLDNYMEADTTDHIRYTASSSSNDSNVHPSSVLPATEFNSFVPLEECEISDQESEDDDFEDDDDEAVNVEDGVFQQTGPRFVSLPRSGKRHPNRKSCRYWSNTGLMVREPRGPLCLYDEPSSPPQEKPRKDSITTSFKEYKHPLLRSYNDLRGGITIGEGGAVREGDKTDQGHGDYRGDAYQKEKVSKNSSRDSCKKISERLSAYARMRNFFRNFLRKKASESTQTDPQHSITV